MFRDHATTKCPLFVLFDFEVPYEQGWFEKAGYVEHRLDPDGALSAEAYIGNTGSITELNWVLLHELGHVIFLAHDDFETSVMYYQSGEPDFSSVLNIAHFTDHDVAATKAIYAR